MAVGLNPEQLTRVSCWFEPRIPEPQGTEPGRGPNPKPAQRGYRAAVDMGTEPGRGPNHYGSNYRGFLGSSKRGTEVACSRASVGLIPELQGTEPGMGPRPVRNLHRLPWAMAVRDQTGWHPGIQGAVHQGIEPWGPNPSQAQRGYLTAVDLDANLPGPERRRSGCRASGYRTQGTKPRPSAA